MAQDSLSSRGVTVRIEESAGGRVVIPALEIVQLRLRIVVVTTVPKGVDVSHRSSSRQNLAKRIVRIGRHPISLCVYQIHYIALKVRDIVVNGCVGTVIINQRIGCSGVVIAEIQRLACPIRLDGFPQQFPTGIDVAVRLGDGFLQNALRCAAAGCRCSPISQTILRNWRLRVCDFYDGRAVGIAAAAASEVGSACPLTGLYIVVLQLAYDIIPVAMTARALVEGIAVRCASGINDSFRVTVCMVTIGITATCTGISIESAFLIIMTQCCNDFGAIAVTAFTFVKCVALFRAGRSNNTYSMDYYTM